MLTPEQARAELDRQRDGAWNAARRAAADRLPDEPRAIAHLLLGDGPRAAAEPHVRYLAVEEAAGRFDALDPDDRARTFGAVFGKLAPWVQGAWGLLLRGPYHVGFSRKAFRAPGRPDVTRLRRTRWLAAFLREIEGCPADPVWLAAWAPHLAPDRVVPLGEADALSYLLAAAIDAGGPVGQAVFDTLIASARGEHDVGGMGRHVIRALLIASRPDGWEFVEKMLLAAQRQEGLRQAILESLDEGRPEAFRRFLRLILDHELARFSATVRAADVWLGLRWEAAGAGVVHRTLERLLAVLEDPAARRDALAGAASEDVRREIPAGTVAKAARRDAPAGAARQATRRTSSPADAAEGAYLALWATAFENATAALAPAAALLGRREPGLRFAAATLLDHLGLPDARAALLPALDDPDLRVASRALYAFVSPTPAEASSVDCFDPIERLAARLPARTGAPAPLVWPWEPPVARPDAAVALLMMALGDRPLERLLPYVDRMDASLRSCFADLLGNAPALGPDLRAALFALIGDASPLVREKALRALQGNIPSPAEAAALEPHLARKSGDLRHAVIGLLASQEDEAALRSAGRLCRARPAPQRLAGLELVRLLAEAGRSVAECRALAQAYRDERDALDPEEEKHLDAVRGPRPATPSLDDALGLLDESRRAPVPDPRPSEVRVATPAALALVRALDRWVYERRHEIVALDPLGEPIPLGSLAAGVLVERDPPGRLLLRAELESWLADRAPETRDPDGLELVRAAMLASRVRVDRRVRARDPRASSLAGAGALSRLRHPGPVAALLAIMACARPAAGAFAWALDGLEDSLHALIGAPGDLARSIEEPKSILHAWLAAVAVHANDETRRGPHEATSPTSFVARHFLLLRALERSLRGLPPRGRDRRGFLPLFSRGERGRPWRCVPLALAAAALEAGVATEHDVIDVLLGPRDAADEPWAAWTSVTHLPPRGPHDPLVRFPALAGVVERCRRRVLEIELERGEMPTAATDAARAVVHAGGMDVLLRTLRRLAAESLPRFSARADRSRDAVLGRILVRTVPRDTDTPAAFAAAARVESFPEPRLVELALAAPQWASHVERALGWKGLADAAWWTIAHAGGMFGQTPFHAPQVAERTPVPLRDLADGAVDVSWFRRAHEALGDERWQALHAAARYASAAAGHKRAQLYADALLGRVGADALLRRVAVQRHPDAVRALGLVPLARGKAARTDLLTRWQSIRDFLRTSRAHGPQRQETERRAAAIALENLARTAGFSDPVRLEWAMEAEALADLRHGPLRLSLGKVEVTLSLDDQARPELRVTHEGRPVQRIPASARRDARVSALLQRKADLQRQAARTRASLEEAMIRGDGFTGAELRELMTHPALAPQLGRLVLVGQEALGYPAHGGRALADAEGSTAPVGAHDRLRLAHPHDLLAGGRWSRWQRECFAHERVQPFKQVFRELYCLTDAERASSPLSRRYAGHQVEPRRALALLGGRGWVFHPSEGVRRTFHAEGLTAGLGFQQAFGTPADLEGLTLEAVGFTRRADGRPVPLADVPPRLFSEVMRDLDLVVGVAHRGGVDPEATASTVELRAALLRETCIVLGLTNVAVHPPHARIHGLLGDYTVHLGSAVVHRQPGGMLHLVAVHGQHRGRLFLPFADDDPRTAEVLSKTILLARDAEIRDPNLLGQIRRSAE